MKKKIKIRFFYFSTNLKLFIGVIVNYFTSKSNLSNELIKNGIIKIKTPGISEYLLKIISDEEYLNKSQTDIDIDILGKNEFGVKNLIIDINSKFLWKYIFTRENMEILKSYYNGNFYLRNNPTINITYDNELHGAQSIHLDWGLRQISFMINLTDVSQDTTHMEYYKSSNKNYWFKHPNRLSYNFQKKAKDFIEKNPNNLYKTISEKDTMFIFDAGNGFHRQVAGGKRVILHLNFVNNLAFTEWDRNWNSPNLPLNHWFSKYNTDIIEKIKNSNLDKNIFSLVLQTHKKNYLTPYIFSHNKI